MKQYFNVETGKSKSIKSAKAKGLQFRVILSAAQFRSKRTERYNTNLLPKLWKMRVLTV